MTDTKLSALTLATAPMSYVYGISGTTPHKHIPEEVFNVKNYGAFGDGSSIDTAAIQAAINAALNYGITTANSTAKGGVVYFPQGEYKIDAPLTFGGVRASIHLVGSGKRCTQIIGSFAGFIIEKPDDNAENIAVITGLTISNARQSPDSGALHLAGVPGLIVSDCQIGGAIGALCEDNTFCAAFYNCHFVSSYFYPNAPGTVGLAMQQVGVYNCRFQSFSIAIASSNSAPVIMGSAAEVCGTGLMLGAAYLKFITSITRSGTTATVTVRDALSTWLPSGTTTFEVMIEGAASGYNTAVNGSTFVTGTVVGSVAGGSVTFTYTLPSDPGQDSGSCILVSPQSLNFDSVSGISINGFQTERCDTGCFVVAMNGANISGMCLTGSIGTWKNIAAASWSTGTATITTVFPLSTYFATGTTTFGVKIDSATNGGYNTPVFVTATVVGTVVGGSVTFTYPLASDPGGTIGSGTATQWSTNQQYGLRIRGMEYSQISGVTISSANVQAAIDLFVDGNTAVGNAVLSGVNVGQGGVILPPMPSRSGYKIVNCDFGLSMTYAGLPGESGVTTAGPFVGQEFDIVDSQVEQIGLGAFGGGSLFVTVQYDGSVWRVVKSSANILRTFSALPTMSQVTGMEYNISDGTNGLTWGDPVTNTGTHTTPYKVRWNGSNWTVVGK